jgi:hypothetical protein
MRIFCAKCASKHIAQAIILLNESKLGYPLHKWLAIGHLAEAETEIEPRYNKFAQAIREVRLEIEREDDSNKLVELLINCIKLIDTKDKTACSYWR